MSRLRRSLLFVPASSEKFFAKAKDSPADTLIFDLEDAVAPERPRPTRSIASCSLIAWFLWPRNVAVKQPAQLHCCR